METATIRIKVQYDAFSRAFRLVNPEFKTLLEGDGVYDLNLPVAIYNEADLEELIPAGETELAHA